MAPEVNGSTGHGPDVDWWDVRVMTYQMLSGYSPFELDEQEERIEFLKKFSTSRLFYRTSTP
jgi:serine/threonine protein kinase